MLVPFSRLDTRDLDHPPQPPSPHHRPTYRPLNHPLQEPPHIMFTPTSSHPLPVHSWRQPQAHCLLGTPVAKETGTRTCLPWTSAPLRGRFLQGRWDGLSFPGRKHPVLAPRGSFPLGNVPRDRQEAAHVPSACKPQEENHSLRSKVWGEGLAPQIRNQRGSGKRGRVQGGRADRECPSIHLVATCLTA